ncbi:MAG: methionyl-tRNA formyltransferase [Cyclobacteriaceae bacterium]|nr:methionyl-tRNA formyltransferase [Cyclobacteriaceae bacterium]
MNSLRIIFMGTPEFAVPSLEILIQNGYRVVAVVTAADKPAGRGQKLTPSPVKECALRHQLPVLQPVNLKSPAFLDELKSYQANLQVVVAFRMLPEVVWSMPALGTFNLHGSLLPDYRGAAPINWAIIRGEKETGVTTFFLKHEIDTGSIIFQEREPILDHDTAGSVYERLMHNGADLVLKTVKAIEAGNAPMVPQPQPRENTHAPKIFTETCQINWDQPTTSVRNFIRGLSPYPGAWTMINGKTVKVLNTRAVQPSINPEAKPGDWESDQKTFIRFATADGHLDIIDFQPEGKKRMTPEEFFRGNKL